MTLQGIDSAAAQQASDALRVIMDGDKSHAAIGTWFNTYSQHVMAWVLTEELGASCRARGMRVPVLPA